MENNELLVDRSSRSSDDWRVFILRGIKNLILLALTVVAVYWAANYKVHGEPLYKVATSFVTSGNYKDSFRDMKTFVGGFLSSVGDEIRHDEVSEKDRNQFEKMIKEKSKEGEKK